jgi:glycosyltransferase involved in cell wall biosynthesis
VQGLWFDGRYIDPVHPDGISRFSLGLIQATAELSEITVMVNSEEQREQLPKHRNIKVFMTNPVSSPRELMHAFKLNNQGVRVLFSPMQTTSGIGRKFKLIYTLHDLIYYRHRTPPADFNFFVRFIWFIYHLSYWPQRRILNMADAVVTVSETTKDQMLINKLTKRPIHVIHNAADAAERFEKTPRHDSKQIVYMGSFIGYKNVETLIRGMKYLPDHILVLLSRVSDRRKAQLQKLADRSNARVQFENGVSDEDYHKWLYRVKALVSASLDEGFGIPIVESMARGCPVVLSDIQIFEEVAGPAGLRFPPFNEVAFSEQIKRLSDRRTWKLQSELGLDQAQFFTWEDSAELLVELSEKLAS